MTTYPLPLDEAIELDSQIRKLEQREKLQAQVDAMEAADAAEFEHHTNSWLKFMDSERVKKMAATQPCIDNCDLRADWDRVCSTPVTK